MKELERKKMSQAELVRRINQEEENIGWRTRTRTQHICNMINNNYVSKLRAMKIERALDLKEGYLSDLVNSVDQGVQLYKDLVQIWECKQCKNIDK